MEIKSYIILSLDEALELYNNEFKTIKEIDYIFIKEIEADLIDHKISDSFSFRFTRDLIWYIRDSKNIYYKAELTEYGDHKDDLTLEPNGDIVFYKINEKITKPRPNEN